MRFQLAIIRLTSLKWVVGDTAVVAVEIDVHAPASGKSSIFLRRIIGSMFILVNSKCAHQVRPPRRPIGPVVWSSTLAVIRVRESE